MKTISFSCALLPAFLILLLSGCAQTFTREGLRMVDEDVGIHRLRAEPQAYAGQTVLLGGAIIEVENFADHTELVILHHELGFTNRPNHRRPSGERFLVRIPRFLDPAIYHPGRWITVLGTVAGGEQRLLQRATYLYPVIVGNELHLWPLDQNAPGRSRLHFGLGIGIGL
ncbi:outer membrane lipoprotein [Desulfonatronum thiosulfatophilum]|uniref:Outer membrane lipoprotein n=1 Tax=Desulfonatronum thiosulfatophilum TaxID=617002 RepID=A0A1G6BBB1_9BACT|nr:Slp family lipoprotein [Desulfonatronum thiosulfatophilum]SDB17833.1 outer membrane lipoprotein [Desulfonatronum thiosulfatophilum]